MSNEPLSTDKSRPTLLEGVRVLVVDDQADSRALLMLSLRQHGAQVTGAPSAAKALEYFQRSNFDVVVSDIGMPIEDGYSLIRKVRALPPERGGQVPALALTGYAMEDDRRRALEAGFQMHIAKPIEPDDLIGLVGQLVGRM